MHATVNYQVVVVIVSIAIAIIHGNFVLGMSHTMQCMIPIFSCNSNSYIVTCRGYSYSIASYVAI